MPSNPIRWVVLTFVAAGAFAIGLVLYIRNATETEMAKAQAEAAAMVERMEKRGTPLLDETSAVAAQFLAHVGAGRFAQAHALLAGPYRAAVSTDAFANACRASAILTARAVTLVNVRQRAAGGASSLEAHGVLDTRDGGVPVTFTFLREEAGPRILVVSPAGVPVLQGLTATK